MDSSLPFLIGKIRKQGPPFCVQSHLVSTMNPCKSPLPIYSSTSAIVGVSPILVKLNGVIAMPKAGWAAKVEEAKLKHTRCNEAIQAPQMSDIHRRRCLYNEVDERAIDALLWVMINHPNALLYGAWVR